MASEKKNTVHHSTFRKWAFKDDFEAEVDDEGYVKSLVCKICRDHLVEIRREARSRNILKGSVAAAIDRYADGITHIHRHSECKKAVL